jgi:predicted RecA/RadA family phage recombinase
MARNYVAPGRSLTLVAPYQRNGGEGALVGSVFGVSLSTVANAASGDFATAGVWDLTKATGQAWTQGLLVYWDNTNKNCTSVSTSNKLIGVAVQAQASGDAIGRVRLNGVFIT